MKVKKSKKRVELYCQICGRKKFLPELFRTCSVCLKIQGLEIKKEGGEKMKITKVIEGKITKLAEKRFINQVVERIIAQTFKQSEERIDHYINQEVAKLGKQITADFPL